MTTVVHRWMALSTDGRPALFELYADNTLHVAVVPEGLTPGVLYTLPIDECHEGLYGKDGTLIVSREPR